MTSQIRCMRIKIDLFGRRQNREQMPLPHNKTMLVKPKTYTPTVEIDSNLSSVDATSIREFPSIRMEAREPDQRLTRCFIRQHINSTETTLLAQKRRQKPTKLEKI